MHILVNCNNLPGPRQHKYTVLVALWSDNSGTLMVIDFTNTSQLNLAKVFVLLISMKQISKILYLEWLNNWPFLQFVSLLVSDRGLIHYSHVCFPGAPVAWAGIMIMGWFTTIMSVFQVLVLRELALCTPTFFFQQVQQFFECIFNAVRDPKVRFTAVCLE